MLNYLIKYHLIQKFICKQVILCEQYNTETILKIGVKSAFTMWPACENESILLTKQQKDFVQCTNDN